MVSRGLQGLSASLQQHSQAQLHILPVPLRTLYLHQDDLFQQTKLFLGKSPTGGKWQKLLGSKGPPVLAWDQGQGQHRGLREELVIIC